MVRKVFSRAQFFFSFVALAALSACSRVDQVALPTERATPSNDIVAFTTFTANIGGQSTPGAVPSPANLRACFSGDNTALDVVSNNLGVLAGGAGYTGGKFGSAFNFLSLLDGVDIPSSASLNVGTATGMTMAAWIYPRGFMFQGPTEDIYGAGPIVEFNQGAHLWHHDQQKDSLAIFANLAEGPAAGQWHILKSIQSAPMNGWTHVAVTYDKGTGTISLWANGVLRASEAAGVFTPNTATQMHIGRRTIFVLGGNNYTFNGAIDEVQLYDRALTPAEVSQLATASGTMCVAPPASYQVTTMPGATAESGVPLSPAPSVAILDANDNIVSNATTPVTATITSGGGTLLGTTTVNAVNGVATFNNLIVAGTANAVISFAAGSLPAEPGFPTSSAPVATTQVPRALGITTQPGGAVSGSPLAPQPVVEIRDAAGLRVPGATNVVNASASGAGIATGNTSATASNGTASFSGLTLVGTGSFTLNFTSIGLTGVSSDPVALTNLPATQLAVISAPVGGESGTPLTTQPVIEARDATGARALLATGTVTAQVVSGGNVGGTVTANIVNGLATFSGLTVGGVGAVTVNFTSASLTPTTAPVTLYQKVRQVAILGGPSTVTSGAVMTPPWIVELRDAAGFRVVGNNYLVQANVGFGTATLFGTKQVSAVDGVVTFSNVWAVGPVETIQISFFVVQGGVDDAYAHVFSGNVSLQAAIVEPPPSTPTQLSLLTAPSANVESGVPFSTQPVVELKTADGSRATSATGTVTVSLQSGASALLGTTTVPVVNGLASFAGLQFNGAGNNTLRFSYGTLPSVTANVTSTQQPRQLAIIGAAPTVANSGAAMAPAWQVEVRDAAGLKINSATTRIKATVASGSALLSGVVELDAVAGVATFPGVIATGLGAVTLRFATLSGTPSVVSAPVNLLPALLAWGGFLNPIDDAPAVNKKEGGSTIPVKFSLGGNVGLAIFAPGYPASQPASCADWAPIGTTKTQISVPGLLNSIVSDATILASLKVNDNKYQIDWKSDKAWDGTCRLLLLKFIDGTTRTARFEFK